MFLRVVPDGSLVTEGHGFMDYTETNRHAGLSALARRPEAGGGRRGASAEDW